MSDFVGKHVIVVGAGMSGLAAAKALSGHFEKVTVLERDALPMEALPRHGTPQARHLHALLAGGLIALKELLPGIETELEQAGAVRLATQDLRIDRPNFDPYPQRALGLSWLSMSRPMLEFVTRQLVERQENIELLGNCRVTDCVTSPDGSAVTGVRYETSKDRAETLLADLVVDASGRGTLALGALESMGLAKPKEIEIGIDMAYSTSLFEQPDDAPTDWKAVIVLPAAPRENRGAFLSPIENNRWIVSVGANHGDAPPGDLEGFLAFAKSLRTTTVYDAIKAAKPIGQIVRFLLPSSVRRRFETIERFPRGLLAVGDTICRFNPVFGQGMSVAAQEAVILDRLLKARAGQPDPLGELAPAFFSESQDVLETPWNVATSDFIYPKTRGERPANFEQRMQFNMGLVRLGAQDSAVQKLMFEVNHLLKPHSSLRAPEISDRVLKLIAEPA
jgi:2-polyprenyl-6-methoxyphenol hydroxylase-like FAD-dependent oxidoreductase